jgi:hypothetical protein
VVFHHVAAGAAVGLALVALVGPAEGRLDAVGGVVGKGQTDGAGGRDRQQVAVADAVLADGRLDVVGQAAGKGAFGQIALGVETGNAPFSLASSTEAR